MVSAPGLTPLFATTSVLTAFVPAGELADEPELAQAFDPRHIAESQTHAAAREESLDRGAILARAVA
jgi:hypothetical protein